MNKNWFFIIVILFSFGLSACGEKSRQFQESAITPVSHVPDVIEELDQSNVSLIKSNALVGGNWSAPFVLGTEAIDSELSIDLAVSGQGDLLSTWGNAFRQVVINTTPNASVKNNNGAEWLSLLPFVVDPEDRVSNLKYHTNSVTNDSYMTWWSDKISGYMISHYDLAGNWEAAVKLGTQSIHRIEVDALGNATILWFENAIVGNIAIHIRKYIAGTGLTHMYTLRRGDAFSAHPTQISALTMTSKLGLTKIAWNEEPRINNAGAAEPTIYSADFIDDVGWQSVTELNAKMPGITASANVINMSIVEDPLLNLYQLVFVVFNPLEVILSYQIYGMTLENDSWSIPQSLDFSDIEGEIVYSNFVRNSQGSFAVFWMESLRDISGSVLILRCRRYIVGQGWNALEIISTAMSVGSSAEPLFSQISKPSISMNDIGDIVAVWYVKDAINTNLWINHYSQALGWGFPEIIVSSNSGAISELKSAINTTGEPSVMWQQKVNDVNGEVNNMLVVEYTP